VFEQTRVRASGVIDRNRFSVLRIALRRSLADADLTWGALCRSHDPVNFVDRTVDSSRRLPRVGLAPSVRALTCIPSPAVC